MLEAVFALCQTVVRCDDLPRHDKPPSFYHSQVQTVQGLGVTAP